MLKIEHGSSLQYDEIKHGSESSKGHLQKMLLKVHKKSTQGPKEKVDNLLINSSPTIFCVHIIVRCLSHIARHWTSKQRGEAGNLK
jgi:hypothetical protein